MAAVDVATTPVPLLLGWLTITLPWAGSLPARAAFADAVRARLVRERGPEQAEAALRGL